MEPDVIRLYSSSPPPMEDGGEEEDDEFGDFDAFSSVPNSISFSEFDTPTTFNQSQALAATSPPDVHNGGGVAEARHGAANGSCGPELTRANGVGPLDALDGSPSERTETRKTVSSSLDCNGRDTEVLTNGFVTFDPQESPSAEDPGASPQGHFADFASFSSSEGLSETDSRPQTAVLDGETERRASPEDVPRIQSPAGSCNTDRGPQRDAAVTPEPSDSDCTADRLSLNGDGGGGGEPAGDTDGEAGQSDEKSSETSLGRLLSTDALEELGDMSTTGSVPSPPPQGATPPEDDFADFEQLEVQKEPDSLSGSGPAAEPPGAEQDDDFGDFNSPRRLSGGRQADFPPSDSFGNFSAAEDSGWSAFGEQQQVEEGEEAWAAFSSVPSGDEAGQEGPSPAVSGTHLVALSSRLQTLFLSCFPADAPPSQQEDRVLTLGVLLEPGGDRPAPRSEERSGWSRSAPGGVWTQLQDVHEALGLRYQWGGSHCNKVLLCCLGIDTRNILFTGQKKQPVIVPMYAAGLGMLEPTKEPVKPVSAAEMIASIAQTPPAAAENSSCPSDPVQEALPPVQFDWSSSGLTNPLDASAGSALLNLDFFGPVEDSGSSSSASIPGVDPELFELTTAKLDSSGAGSRVADAFARLMSTMEKTSTSTRKPRKDENLSEEASKLIASLPDLSFMQAKVLMFPATLTPLCSQATPPD
ncbi:aftiphilin a [Fundulus diaphanus]